MNFIYCFDDDKYKELLLRGFTFIHQFKSKDKYVYVFKNDGIMTFSKEDEKILYFTNKLFF